MEVRVMELALTGFGAAPHSTEQTLSLMKGFSLPQAVHGSSWQRKLLLKEPTSELLHYPRESPSRTPS